METNIRSFATSLLIAAIGMPAASAQAESFATAAGLGGELPAGADLVLYAMVVGALAVAALVVGGVVALVKKVAS